MLPIGSDRQCRARPNQGKADARDATRSHFLSPPRRCISSLRACATTADGTPLDLLSVIRSFSRRNGNRRIASVTGVFGLRHSEYFVPYSLVHSRLDAM